MKVIVTGAAGLTGGEVIRLLVESGHAVTGIVRRAEPAAVRSQGVEMAVADLRDTASLATPVRGADALVHVAGITLAPYVARVPGLADLRCVVVVSSAAVRSAHRAAAAAYRAGEEAILRARPDAVVVRPTMIYGSRRDRNVHYVIELARRLRALPLIGDGRALVQPVHYRDVAAATVALIGTRPPGPVDVGGAEPLTLRAAGEAVFAALGMRPRFIAVPTALASGVARILDRTRYGRWSERVARMSEDRTADNALLVTLTGVRPRDLRTGVAQQVAEMLR